MELTLVEGLPCHLEACTRMLENSELGQHYFPTYEMAHKGVEEFLGTDWFLVALDESGQPAGFLCCLPQGAFHSYPYLHLLVTAPHLRGAGIGTIIMDEFERRIALVRNKLFLCVAGFNSAAERFYLKRGYVRVGTIPSLYREGIDEYLMMRKLDE